MSTDYLAQALLNHVYRNTPYSSEVTVYSGLIQVVTDAEAGTITESSYTGYTRQATAFDAPAADAGGHYVDNTAQESYGQKTDGGSVTIIAIGVWDASSSGNLLSLTFVDADAPVFGTFSSASPGVCTAPNNTLANGQTVRLEAVPGAALPTGLSEDTEYTIANLSGDTFDLGTTTSSTGTALVRPYTGVTVNQNDTPQLAAGALKIYLD
jgi:hypothetical protein